MMFQGVDLSAPDAEQQLAAQAVAESTALRLELVRIIGDRLTPWIALAAVRGEDPAVLFKQFADQLRAHADVLDPPA